MSLFVYVVILTLSAAERGRAPCNSSLLLLVLKSVSSVPIRVKPSVFKKIEPRNPLTGRAAQSVERFEQTTYPAMEPLR
jgi:hypothetical protein